MRCARISASPRTCSARPRPNGGRAGPGGIAAGETIGSGVSETGEARVGQFDTVIRRRGGERVVDGRKFYTTGSLFADWIHLSAQDEDGAPVVAAVSTRAPGVEIVDDWDGFGQALTASGTAHFTGVVVEPDWIKPDPARFPYAMAFFQLVHLATLAGIGRAAAEDVARLVAERRRVYSHGNAAHTRDDPQGPGGGRPRPGQRLRGGRHRAEGGRGGAAGVRGPRRRHGHDGLRHPRRCRG